MPRLVQSTFRYTISSFIFLQLFTYNIKLIFFKIPVLSNRRLHQNPLCCHRLHNPVMGSCWVNLANLEPYYPDSLPQRVQDGGCPQKKSAQSLEGRGRGEAMFYGLKIGVGPYVAAHTCRWGSTGCQPAVPPAPTSSPLSAPPSADICAALRQRHPRSLAGHLCHGCWRWWKTVGVSLFLRVSVFLQRFLFAIALSYFLTSFSSHCQPLTNGDFRPNNMTGNGLA